MLRNWLRTWVRDSILAGAEDAVRVLAGDDQADDTTERITTLKLRLLPSPEPSPTPAESDARPARKAR